MSNSPGDFTIDQKAAAAWSVPIALALIAVVMVPHAILYRENALTALFTTLRWWWIPATLAGIVAHELLHGVTMCALARQRWQDVAFGVNWALLMPFAHPRRPIPARAYVVGAAMPGLVLGLAPAIAGLTLGSGAWSGWGALFLAAAAGDILVIYAVWDVPAATLVRDHPARVGCELAGAES
jgi:hypothetical protein